MENNKKVLTKKRQIKYSTNKVRLAELYAEIEQEVEFVDIKPYSHNIISCILRIISKEFGYNKANEAIDEFNLTSLGWHHEKQKH